MTVNYELCGLSETTNNWDNEEDFNQKTPEYEAGFLTTRRRRSVAT
jgi:hypothetical protein